MGNRRKPNKLERVSMRLMSGFPVVFVSGIVVWSYYAYVIVMCGKYVDSIAERVLFLVVYHVILALHAVSYYRTINTPAGSPPKQFYLSDEQVELMEGEATNQNSVLTEAVKGLPVRTRLPDGRVRYCDRCKMIKPDRTHHCSLCRHCVLKMDHHCPWVNNCVGYGNYKFFILFLFYTVLFTMFIGASSCPSFLSAWRTGSDHKPKDNSTSTSPVFTTSDRLNIIFVFFIAVLFCLSLLSLFSFHLYLLTNNQTTLESGRPNHFDYGPDKKGFSLGWRKNVEQVMGRDPLYWILPVDCSLGNGYEFPLRLSDGERERLLAVEEGRHSYSETEDSA